MTRTRPSAAALLDKVNDRSNSSGVPGILIDEPRGGPFRALPLLPNQEEAAGLKREMYELTVKADGVYGAFRNELLRRL